MRLSGLSLRDWFAGMALQGLLAGQFEFANEPMFRTAPFATAAYQLADSMLAERVKP